MLGKRVRVPPYQMTAACAGRIPDDVRGEEEANFHQAPPENETSSTQGGTDAAHAMGQSGYSWQHTVRLQPS